MFWAEHAIRRAMQPGCERRWPSASLMGAAFLGNQVLEYRDLGFAADDNAYASLFIVITGLHGLHVLVGLVMSASSRPRRGPAGSDPAATSRCEVFGIYWHFVDVVWIFVFASLYLAAHLAGR